MITPGDFSVKNADVFRSLCERRFSPLLLSIIEWIGSEYGVMITEGYREKRHRNDLHGTQPVRAIDCRSWDYPAGWETEIERVVNQMWQYDPWRPEMKVCVWHNVGQGVHFHVQVHPNTRKTM